jgi:hypothetical protein
MRFPIAAAFTLVLGFAAGADEPKPAFEPLLTKPAKLQWQDAMKEKFTSDWTVAKGKWTPLDNAMQVAELKEDMHGAVARRKIEGKDLAIQFSFRLDGANTASLSLNGAKGHVCRFLAKPSGFSVNKDDTDGKNGPDKGEVLHAVATPLKAGQWYTVLVEMCGPELVARIDGKEVASGSHKAIDAPKANLGLTCAGETASFRNLIVWSAEPNPTWAESKAKLEKEKAKK